LNHIDDITQNHYPQLTRNLVSSKVFTFKGRHRKLICAHQPIPSERRAEMKLPKTVSVWFMVLFFLFAGLSALGVSLGGAIWGILTGIFALGAAVFLFLGK
jgi:hypothetical protein